MGAYFVYRRPDDEPPGPPVRWHATYDEPVGADLFALIVTAGCVAALVGGWVWLGYWLGMLP